MTYVPLESNMYGMYSLALCYMNLGNWRQLLLPLVSLPDRLMGILNIKDVEIDVLVFTTIRVVCRGLKLSQGSKTRAAPETYSWHWVSRTCFAVRRFAAFRVLPALFVFFR